MGRKNNCIDISSDKEVTSHTTWLRKIILETETESLLLAAQNNSIETKIKVEKTRQNSKCRLYGDWDKTTNHKINGCSKLVQKEYKTRYDWVAKVIHLELCKKFKFDHTVYAQPRTLWKMRHTKFPGISRYKQITRRYARRPDKVIVNKKENLPISGFCRPGKPQGKTERKEKKS